MRRKILYIFISAFVLCFIQSCVKYEKQNIYALVKLKAIYPNSKDILSIDIDSKLKGNFFKNYNNGYKYEIPTFINGECEIKILKGLYIISFDAIATLKNGEKIKLRSSEFSSPQKAVKLIEDQMVLELNLIEL